VKANGNLDALVDKYLQELPFRNFATDMELALDTCEAGKTKSVVRCAVMQLLDHHDVELDRHTTRLINEGREKGESEPETEDRIPTLEEARQIINQLDIRGKAITLMALSSGARINEILSLQLSDLHLDTVPASFFIRKQHAKTKKGRLALISSEAADHAREYLKSRPYYVGLTEKRRRSASRARDNGTVFSIAYQTYAEIFNRALVRAGLDGKDGKRNLLHPHTLRKFFYTRMKIRAKVPGEMVDILVGHSTPLANAYLRMCDGDYEEIKKAYLDGEHVLIITGAKAPVQAEHTINQDQNALIGKLLEKITRQDEALQALAAQVAALQATH
jgi:integrase